MTTVSVAFFVEPFEEGAPGAHVRAAVDAVERAGLAVDLGPFASLAAGPVETVADALARLVRDAFDAGATRVQVEIERA